MVCCLATVGQKGLGHFYAVLAIAILLLFVACASAQAQADSEKFPSKASGQDSRSVDTPPKGKIPPLDAWVRKEPGGVDLDAEPEENSKPSKKPEDSYFFINEDDLKVDEDVDAGEVDEPAPTLPDERRLSTKKRKRIERAMKKQRKRVIKVLSQAKRNYHKDRRGEAELRVCSMNANGYGSKGTISKLLRGKKKYKKNSRKGKAIAKAILQAKCDVVALQGVLARDYDSYVEAIERIIRRLNKKDKKDQNGQASKENKESIENEEPKREWKFYLGETNDRFVTNVFLLDTKMAEYVIAKSYEGTLLPRYDRFQEKKFIRGPFKITLKVKKKGSEKKRELVLLTASAQAEKAFDKKKVEKISYRMQVAEAFRQISTKVQRELDPNDPAIMVLLFESYSHLRQPTNYILEGRLKLIDFRDDALCKIIQDPESEEEIEEEEDPKKMAEEQAALEEKDGFFSCTSWPKHPARLVPLLRSSVQPRYELKKYIKDGEPKLRKIDLTQDYYRKKKQMIVRTPEIFVVPEDLKYVNFRHDTPGRYAVGELDFKNYLDNSPLVWVDINF